MAQQAQNTHVKVGKFTEVSWESIQEPGCYVDALAGDLYRIPQEALLSGSSPIIHKVSTNQGRFVQLSNDPTLTTFQARMLAADLDIKPNF
ncbi:MAG: hypothetical protein EPN49_07940 [Rhodanobacter sp.]|nr:MAG: hypothetical protein EPN49_07940 [Rhodanobacter sp.]